MPTNSGPGAQPGGGYSGAWSAQGGQAPAPVGIPARATAGKQGPVTTNRASRATTGVFAAIIGPLRGPANFIQQGGVWRRR